MSGSLIIVHIFFFVEFIIIGICNLYLIAYLAHPNDNKFATSIFSRITIWIGFTVVYLPFITIYYDAQQTQNYFDEK